jgi:ethanolamine permease
MGPSGGFLAGVAQAIEYSLSVAVLVVSVGAVLREAAVRLTGTDLADPFWWVALYVVFLFLNACDVGLFFRVGVLLAVASLAVLAWFWVLALPEFRLDLALDVPPAVTGTAWLPHGIAGIAWAIPFAVWFYLALEATPLAAEEADRPAQSVRRGLYLGFATLVVAAFLTLVLNAGSPPGASRIGASDQPLLLGLTQLIGGRVGPVWLALMATVGFAAAIHTITFAAGRSFFALARAGYLPPILATLRPGARTPLAAMITRSLLGLALIVLARLVPADVPLDAVLLNMAVFAALISYMLQFLSFLVLRKRHGDMPRPYASPLGVAGAVVGLALAAGCFLLLFFDAGNRPSLFGCAALYAAALVYVRLRGRGSSAEAPEERLAEHLA